MRINRTSCWTVVTGLYLSCECLYIFFSNYIYRIKLSFVQRTSLAPDNMMDNCPIHTHLNIDVAIGLDLACTLPSTRAKNVITENKRLFIHVNLTQAISCLSSLKVPTLLFLLIFSCHPSLRLPFFKQRFFFCFFCQDNLWCNWSVFKLGVEWEARGRVKYSSVGTPSLGFRSLLLLVGGSWRAAVTSLSECALSFKRLTSPRHWWDGVRHVLNSLKTIIILRPSWRLRLLPFILFQNFSCRCARLWCLNATLC